MAPPAKDGNPQEKTEVRSLLTRSSDLEQIALKVDGIVEKIYANMSACHLKNQNWKRAQETADKVMTVRRA
jgi:hypothetical protein